MQEDILAEVPTRKMYKEGHIAVAAFLTGPIAAGIMMAHNFKTMGKASAATTTIVLTIGAFALIVFTAFVPVLEDIPNIVFSIAFAVTASLITKQYQRAAIDLHTSMGGKIFSGWRVFWLSVACIAGTVALFVGVLYLADPGAFYE